MEDKIKINALLDCYDGLLTKKQNTICQMYYREDLSLQEIADILNVSRSAIHDTIKRCKNELFHFETKLNMYQSFVERRKIYQKIKEITNDQYLIQLIDQCIKTEIEGD